MIEEFDVTILEELSIDFFHLAPVVSMVVTKRGIIRAMRTWGRCWCLDDHN